MEEKEENKYCKRCHRQLKDEQSKQLGFGPVCYQKQIKKKVNYLFNMEDNKMNIEKRDLIMFYELLSRYSKTSTNIAVTGTEKEFKTKMQNILKSIKDYDYMRYSNTHRPKYMIVKDDIEQTYIHIQNTDDMKGLYFRKFM